MPLPTNIVTSLLLGAVVSIPGNGVSRPGTCLVRPDTCVIEIEASAIAVSLFPATYSQ